MHQIAPSITEHIDVTKQPVARLVINYYWVLLLASLILFLYQRQWKPALIELSFYPLFFLVGGQVKYFLQERVAYVFNELRQTGSLPEQALRSSEEDFKMRLNSRLGNIFGFVGALSIVWFYRNTLIIMSPLLSWLASILVAIIDVLLAYVIGVVIWKAVATGFEIRRLGSRGLLRIRPFHPDKCAGLGAIGRLCFSLSLILASISLFLCGWILYARWIHPNFNSGYSFFEPWFAGSLIVLTAVSMLAFFLPMIAVHRLMKDQAAEFKAKLMALGDRISDLEESLLSQGSQLEQEQLEAEYARIQFFRNVYTEKRKIPTWPIDLQTFLKFLSVQIPLSIGFLNSVLSLWEKMG